MPQLSTRAQSFEISVSTSVEHAAFHQDDVGGACFATVRQDHEAIDQASDTNGPDDAGRTGRVLRQPPVATARFRHRRDAGTDLRSGDTLGAGRARRARVGRSAACARGFPGHRAARLTIDKAAVATLSESPGPGSGRSVTRVRLDG